MPSALLIGAIVTSLAGAQALTMAEPVPLPPLADRLAEEWRWRELELPEPALGEAQLVPRAEGGFDLLTAERLAHYDGTTWQTVALGSPPAGTIPGAGGAAAVVAIDGLGLLAQKNSGELQRITRDGTRRIVAASDRTRLLVRCPTGAVLTLTSAELARWDGERLVTVAEGPGATPEAAACLEPDRLVVSAGRRLWERRDGGWRQVNTGAAFEPIPLVSGVAADPRQALFLAAQGGGAAGGAWRVVGSRVEPVAVRSEDLPLRAAVLWDGALIGISTLGMLLVQDPHGWHEPNVPWLRREGLLRVAVVDGTHLVVHTTAGKLFACDLTSRRWIRVPLAGVDPSEPINAIAPARSGGFWLGMRSGLIRWVDGRVVERHHRFPIAAQVPAITTLWEDDAGDLWAGSGSGFRGVLRRRAGRWQLIDREVGGVFVHAIRPAPDGSLWLLGFAGFPGERPGGGISVWQRGSWRRYGSSDGLPDERFYDVVFEPDGRAVVASRGQLLRFARGRFEPFEPGARREVWFSLLRQSTGRIWAGMGLSRRGVFWSDGRTLFQPTIDGFTDASAGSIVEDPAGRIWLGSVFGLAMFDGRALHQVGAELGLEWLQVWPIVADHDRAGGLWLGALRGGLVHHQPDDRDPPQTERIEVAGQGRERTIRLRWSARDRWNVTQPRMLRYQVAVDGVPRGGFLKRPELELDALATGRHTVTVQALDLSGNLEPIGPTLEFEIALPLWRRPPFVGVALAALASVLALAITLRRRGLERAAAAAGRSRALAVSERHFRSLVEHAEIVLLRTDSDSRLSYVSPPIERLTGYPASEFLRRKQLLHAVVHEADRAIFRRLATARSLVTPVAVTADLRLLHRGGEERRVLVRQSPWIDEHGVLRGFDAVVVDVTQRQELEEALAYARKLESLGVMAGGIAHDFNNLLVVILGNTDLARSSLARGGRPLAELDAIALAGGRAAEVCRQMLIFSGRMASVRRRFDAVPVLASVQELMRAAVPHNITLQFDLPSRVLPIEGDPSQLPQLLMNLVLNAAEACGGRPGNVWITLGDRWLGSAELSEATLGAECEPGRFVELSVVDDGAGMDEAIRARIFDPFFSTKFTGRGLGLAAVLGIVRAHHGCILVDSDAGRGSSFLVCLPWAERLDEHREVSAPQPVGGHGTLLVVDDEPLVRATLGAMLTQAGFEVLLAGSGDEALTIFRRERARILAVVLDRTMPDGDGLVLLSALRGIDPTLPAVLCSGYEPPSTVVDGVIDPCTRFVGKPFRAGELLDALLRLLDAAPREHS